MAYRDSWLGLLSQENRENIGAEHGDREIPMLNPIEKSLSVFKHVTFRTQPSDIYMFS